MPRVTITRTALGRYKATAESGAELHFGEGDDEFSAVELLLAALGGCTGADVDYLTSRRAQPSDFDVVVEAEKVKDPEQGNRLSDVTVTFRLRFPDGDDGDAARTVLPVAVQRSHDRLCTVGRTVELPTPVVTHIE
ncbi:MAG: OsmC family protein [Candidatus Nanopelagicales bacterium]|jgi:uncharacterized OsmC-like protein|nr:OsmC family protein [Candidatus Nanopelagicales bacterium]